MKIGVVGCGAIGGLLATRLAGAAEDVTVLDLPTVRQAIAAYGLALVEQDGTRRIAPVLRMVASGREAGTMDVVLLATKAQDLPAAAPDVAAMLGPDTMVVTLQNGLPWWYFLRHGGPLDGRPLTAADPDGILARHLPAASVVGCVAYPAATLEAPGVIRHVEGDRFPIGELDGTTSPRIEVLSALLGRAGFRSRVLPDIRAELWLKAVGAAAFNPLSAVTGLTMAEIAARPDTRARALALMTEAQAVAHALGITLRVSLDQRLAGAAAVGHHKTSMLQDVEAGRPTELAAIVDTIIEIAGWVGVPVPALRQVAHEVRALEVLPRLVATA